jgi:hypothetical protein
MTGQASLAILALSPLQVEQISQNTQVGEAGTGCTPQLWHRLCLSPVLAMPILSRKAGIFDEVYKGPGVPQPHCDTASCFFCCINVLGDFRFETRREVYQVEV